MTFHCHRPIIKEFLRENALNKLTILVFSSFLLSFQQNPWKKTCFTVLIGHVMSQYKAIYGIILWDKYLTLFHYKVIKKELLSLPPFSYKKRKKLQPIIKDRPNIKRSLLKIILLLEFRCSSIVNYNCKGNQTNISWLSITSIHD